MKKELSPFLTENYISKEYFCDREAELALLKKYAQNSVNITLLSNRRLGKSALIHRFFEDMEAENYACIYADIFATGTLKEFTEELAAAIFKRFPKKRGIGRKFFDLLMGFRPVITYDALSGTPEIRFEYVTPAEYETTLKGLLTFLDSQNQKVIVAIDEFTQVADYPEKKTEALLRTVVQTLTNTNFIFCGSKKHLMLEMFNTANRPFFSSTLTMGLDEITADKYAAFITEKFALHKRSIDSEAVTFILDWTLRHTYYTQFVCNAIFADGEKKIGIDVVKRVCDECLRIQQTTFMQYRSLLAPVQWRLLVGIAKEGIVTKPQAKDFLRKYNIGAASSVKSALNALLDKEMVCTLENPDKTAYRVYNVFLMRWLARTIKLL
ncbi:MAG: ATP-binding protein [Tannerella sp.]|jgi:hypothetical protein|nr:ATP-binding protein [Tannerella sp.]